MSNKNKSMWRFPWKYKESIAIIGGLLLVGFLLQITLGSFNFFLLHFPINIGIGIALIVLTVILSSLKNNPFISWLSSIPLSVTLIGALLILGIIMGLTPQFVKIDPHHHIHWDHVSFSDIFDYALIKLGFRQITVSWPFVLIYSFTLLSLGLVIAKRMRQFKWKDYGFYLNHFGLWLFLFSAGFGSADMLRHVMYVEEGEIEWRVFGNHDNMLELDIAIQLHDFVMEEYQPKLAVIDKFTGDVMPKNKPSFYQIDERKPSAEIFGWKITLDEYIHEAIRMSDTTYQHIPMAGSMPAAKVTAKKLTTNEEVKGWITCGSIDQFVKPLDLDSTYSIVMTKPEPKRFASDITVIAKDESFNPVRTTLEVNKPLTMGSWMIYQYDYDHPLGKASQMSGFELVYDPWLYLSYLGILLIALGSVCMLWIGNNKKRKS